jgi:hypothetical protein
MGKDGYIERNNAKLNALGHAINILQNRAIQKKQDEANILTAEMLIQSKKNEEKNEILEVRLKEIEKENKRYHQEILLQEERNKTEKRSIFSDYIKITNDLEHLKKENPLVVVVYIQSMYKRLGEINEDLGVIDDFSFHEKFNKLIDEIDQLYNENNAIVQKEYVIKILDRNYIEIVECYEKIKNIL